MTKEQKEALAKKVSDNFWSLTTWQERARFIILLQNGDVGLLSLYDPKACNYMADLLGRAEKDEVLKKELKEVTDAASLEFKVKEKI